MLISQTPSGDIPHDLLESSAIAIFVLSLVVPERLFVQIAEQMERFNRNICAIQRAFQKAPKVLQSIRVNMSLDIFYGMIGNLTDPDVRRLCRASVNTRRISVSSIDLG